MSKYKVAAVSYLNAKPFLHGLHNYHFKNEIKISVDTPANIASQLLKGEVDLALVPIATLPQMKEYFLLPDYCIGGDGAVQSVCIFSEQPFENCKSLLLDYQSRTSVLMAKILLKNYWRQDLNFLKTEAGYEEKISGDTAGLVIGDRTLQLKNKFKHVEDLGEIWKNFSGLPFVFAVWGSSKPIPENISTELLNAFQLGMNEMDKVIEAEEKNYPGIDVRSYFKTGISFTLDERKMKAMNLFFNYLTYDNIN